MKHGFLTAIVAAGSSGCLATALLDKVTDHESALDHACDLPAGASPTAEVCSAIYSHEEYKQVKLPPVLQDALAFYALPRPHHSDAGVSEDDLPGDYAHALAIDPDAVDAAMRAAEVAPVVASAFDQHLRAFGHYVVTTAEAQPPAWRKIYVDPTVAARAAWQAADARRAPWRAKLVAFAAREDAIALENKRDPALLGEMVAMQRGYVADCTRAGVAIEDCLGDEIVRPLARRIVRTAGHDGQIDLALSERELFELPDRSQLDVAVRAAAAAAVEVAKADRDAWEKARADGRSDAALAARWPTEPIQVGREDLPGALPDRDAEENLIDLSHTSPRHERGYVTHVARKGDRAVITFKTDIRQVSTGGGCRETNKVDSIDEDGHVHYRQECYDDGTTERQDATIRPITVPWVEAQSVRAGEILMASVDDKTRAAHVLRTNAAEGAVGFDEFRDDDVGTPRLQIAEFRLTAHAPEAKAARRPKAR